MSPPGRLYLVPAPLDFGCATQAPIEDVLPAHALSVAARLSHWIVENARTARACLKRISQHRPLVLPLQSQSITELPRELHKRGDSATALDLRPLLQPAVDGHDMGLMSEAGLPAVADPGASIVRAAHDLGVPVEPLVGPSSLLLALMASGLNGQSFAFVGYLPQDPGARLQRIRELEAMALKTGQSQLFIETPYRNAALLAALLQALQPSTRLSISSSLTMPQARTHSASVKRWKEAGEVIDGPAVFAIGR